MERYLCIHGHFYQPPRENPWLEAIELQDSAYPYHDWNERITAECYAPNRASRILDGEGRIVKIVNNYCRISFNFGPTLLSWMEDNSAGRLRRPSSKPTGRAASASPATARRSRRSTTTSSCRWPTARDKDTQVVWGIRDFEHRFGRKPEGMWLPETAVDMETLEMLAEHGIKFTILAPHQARQARRIGRTTGRNVDGGKIDPTHALYLQAAVGPQHHPVLLRRADLARRGLRGLLNSGENFADRLIGGFTDNATGRNSCTSPPTARPTATIIRMATWRWPTRLHHIESNNLAKLTNYGEYLEHIRRPTKSRSSRTPRGAAPTASSAGAAIAAATPGGTGWNQAWRAPLRDALDWLRDSWRPLRSARPRELLQAIPGRRATTTSTSCSTARPRTWNAFFAATRAAATRATRTRVDAAEAAGDAAPRHADVHQLRLVLRRISGIETVQVHAVRGACGSVGAGLFGDHREQHFLEHLSSAPSNLDQFKNGSEVYRTLREAGNGQSDWCGSPLRDQLALLRIHHHRVIYCYEADVKDSRVLQAGALTTGSRPRADPVADYA